jgi:signal transduction histidine kinase
MGMHNIPENLLIMVLLSVEVVLAMKPIKGLMVIGLTLLIFTVVSFISFWPFGFWINMAHPILGVFISYYFLIPYRLIMENRKSWELFQKNKLLTQVEELKTNFIGMMSHDLKTPLARIQGMIEIMSRDKNSLSEDQKSALKSIRHSTEDLLNFISTILNFSRLESEGAHLNLKSKDINTIINEVIIKCDDLAQAKNIQITKELEPLFSIKLDPDLIRQVIFNLVENAIKYSPELTEIKIKSEEKDGSVRVSVADQGMGIPEDELSRLFMKFFRSRKAKNSPIKGSGLGLYLSKYFVELHKGKLSAISEESKGSTFTIELPIT